MNEVHTYTTGALARLFDVSPQTVKNWAVEFANYLSPTAKPSAGGKRRFIEDDLRVFALVHRHDTYEDAHVALRAGQRGDVPNAALTAARELPPALFDKLQHEIANRDQLIEELREQRAQERGRAESLEKQIAGLNSRIESLLREAQDAKTRLELYESGRLKPSAQ